MVTRTSPTFRRRQLARRIRQLREEAGMTLHDAANGLDMSKSALSRKENGEVATSVHEVRSMMDLYDHCDSELIELARAAKQKGWWRDYGIEDRGYVDLETEASVVREFSLMYVPGLLQTEEYMRAIFASQDQIERRRVEKDTAVRKIRQTRLTSEEDPVHLVAIIDEGALRRPIGGPAAMLPQLLHLLDLAELPTVEFRVLPQEMGWHAGMDGSFILLEYPGPVEGDVLFLAHAAGSLHVEKECELRRAKLLFEELFACALSGDASKRLIECIAREMRESCAGEGAVDSMDLTSASWQKTSYSGSGSGNGCVEVAFVDSVVAVRDSKDPDGPALTLSPRLWSAFLQRLDRQ